VRIASQHSDAKRFDFDRGCRNLRVRRPDLDGRDRLFGRFSKIGCEKNAHGDHAAD
jgi:hypothetical protein